MFQNHVITCAFRDEGNLVYKTIFSKQMRDNISLVEDKGVTLSNANFTIMWHADFEEAIMVFKTSTPVLIKGRGCM